MEVQNFFCHVETLSAQEEKALMAKAMAETIQQNEAYNETYDGSNEHSAKLNLQHKLHHSFCIVRHVFSALQRCVLFHRDQLLWQEKSG